MTLWQRMHQLMELQKLNKGRLSTLSGVPRSTLTNLEKGKQKSLSISSVRRVAKALGVSVDTLIGEDMKAA